MRLLVPHSLYPGFPDLDESGDRKMPVALGGDLTVERVLIGYKQGIYPCFMDDRYIFWWSPDPRTVLFPDDFKVSRSLRKSIQNRGYRVTVDKAFEATIRNCAASPRAALNEEDMTWITDGMIDTYCELHRLGFAHSVETWHGDELVGGLYGVSIGKIFFGESMFSKQRDASKVALFQVVQHLKKWNFSLIDCQDPTRLLLSLGAVQIPRKLFLQLLRKDVGKKQSNEIWKDF